MLYIHVSFTSKGLNHLFEGDIAGNVSRQIFLLISFAKILKKPFLHMFNVPAAQQKCNRR